MRYYFWPKPLYIDDDGSVLCSHGAAILLLVREGDASDWESLCRAFKFAPRDNHSGTFELRNALRELIAAGLLESENLRGPYRVIDRWEQVQRALGISLVEAANLTRHDALAVRPLFGPRPELTAAPHVFVLMPFDNDLQPVYTQIKRVCRRLQLSVERADDIFSASPVMDDVWRSLCNAGVVVADCTLRNPNVFYEIGIAHTIGKDVILLTQARSDVPFDVRHLRYIEYNMTSAGLRKLAVALRKTLEVGRGRWPPNPRVEKDAERRAAHPKRQAFS
jgi:hypothetical protein